MVGDDVSNAGNIAVPFVKENPAKKQQEIAYERRMEILDLIKRIGFRNVRRMYKGLAEHYHVHWRRMYEDFDWIKGNIRPENLPEMRITCRVASDRALDVALEKFDKDSSIENAMKLCVINKAYREEIEAWGEKEKIVDKLAVGVLYGDVVEIARQAGFQIKKRSNAVPVEREESQGDS